MAACGSCGTKDATRVVSVIREGAWVDKCNLCAAPGDSDFAGPAMVPSDKKMWPDWEVNPDGYKKRGDVLVATDETLADLQREVTESPDADAKLEEAKRKKREFAAQKNQNPLTQVEIDDRVKVFREQREDVEKMIRYQDSGLVLP